MIENDNARVIDATNGNVKMEAGRYKYIGDFHNGLAEASTESIFSLRKMRKIGFINQEGALIIPMIYDDDSKNIDFSGGIAVLKKSDKFGVINTKNETIIPFEYEQITAFNN